jgi:Ni,Fe-hydrogenase I small subunit
MSIKINRLDEGHNSYPLVCRRPAETRNYGSKFVVLGYNSTYFSNKIQKGKTCYSEEQVISMLEFLIDNIFVSFGGILFQQVVGIPMGTNCAPLLADSFLYSYESGFLQKLVKDKKIHNVINIPVCEIKGSSLMNLLIFYKLLKKPRLI